MGIIKQENEPLWTLKDQMELAWKNYDPHNPKAYKTMLQKVRAYSKQLEDALSLYNDGDRIAMMEQVLIEHGLMELVDKRTMVTFVNKRYLDQEKKKVHYYKQLLQAQIKIGLELERFLSNVLGAKQLPGDEKL